jgi:hypothetical protein
MLELDGDYQPDGQINAQDNARSGSDRDPATAASGESPFELRRVSEDETPSSVISSLSTRSITVKAATTMLPMVIPSTCCAGGICQPANSSGLQEQPSIPTICISDEGRTGCIWRRSYYSNWRSY